MGAQRRFICCAWDFVNSWAKLICLGAGKPAKWIVCCVSKWRRNKGKMAAFPRKEIERERAHVLMSERQADTLNYLIPSSERASLPRRSLGQQAASSDLAADRAVAPSARSPSQPLVPAQGKTSSWRAPRAIVLLFCPLAPAGSCRRDATTPAQLRVRPPIPWTRGVRSQKRPAAGNGLP